MFRPIVLIASAFAAGIALGRFTGISQLAWLVLAITGLGVGGFAQAAGRSAAAVLLLAVAATGALWYNLHAVDRGERLLLPIAGRNVILTGTVVRPPQISAEEEPGPPASRGQTALSRRRTRAVIAVEQTTPAVGGLSPGALVLVTVRSSAALRYGDRVRVGGRLIRPPPAGNPGEFSYRDYLAMQGVVAQVLARPDIPVRVLGHVRINPVLAGAAALKEHMVSFFRRALPGPPGALLASLLLGDDGAISADLREAFRRAGLLHVLVVSGAQVGLVLGAVLWLVRAFRAPPAVSGIAAAAGVVFFALMAGWVPSVARATIMALVGTAALLVGRDRDGLAALAFAALVLLVSNPLLLFDVGFQLSFVATWALIDIAPALADRLVALPRAVRALVSMTVAAQLGVLPLLAYHFMQLSVVGFVANLVVVPLVAILVPAGFSIALLGSVAPGPGALLAALIRPVVDLVVLAAWTFAHLPLAAVPYGPVSIAGCAAYYGVLVAAGKWLRGRLRITRPMLVAAVATVLAFTVWSEAAGGAPRLTITFLDVGQGDAIVVSVPSGRTMLIDGGGELEGHATGYDVGMQRVVPALRRMGVRAIDVMALTHPHEDHVGGLVAVAKNFPVSLVLDSGFAHPAPSYAELLRLIEARRIPYRLARRGMVIDLGGGAQALVLYPIDPLLVGTGSDINNNSIVLRLSYGAVSVLFTGDIEALVEARLLDSGDDLRSAVLKVGHHGSATSSTPAFLDAVSPAVAVISVGTLNPFGHPHRVTLENLAAAGARVYRTDHHGAVTVETDGRRIWVRTTRDAGDY